MQKTSLAIFCGGNSFEHDVSLISARSIIKAINHEKYNLFLILITRDGNWVGFTLSEFKKYCANLNSHIAKDYGNIDFESDSESESDWYMESDSEHGYDQHLNLYCLEDNDFNLQAIEKIILSDITKAKNALYDNSLSEIALYQLQRDFLLNKYKINLINAYDIQKLNFNVIFSVLHGNQGEDGVMQGMFESIGIPYVGSNLLASSICMDKHFTKTILKAHNIPVTPWMIIKKQDLDGDIDTLLQKIDAQFGYPCFVKPNSSGSSVGVSKIFSKDDAYSKMLNALNYSEIALVEKYINARELEIAILGDNNSLQVSDVGEIVIDRTKHEFYTYKAKYIDLDGLELKILTDQDLCGIENKIKQYAEEAFNVMRCSGLARIDFLLSLDSREVFLNEINTLPGFTEISMYPRLLIAKGINYADLIDKLVAIAVSDYNHRKRYSHNSNLKF